MKQLDPTTVMLTGALPLALLLSGFLTAPISGILLRLYRRSVLRLMSVESGSRPAPPPRANVRTHVPPLRVITVGADHERPPEAARLHREATSALWRCAGAYAGAGLVYALVLATTWMILAGGGFLPVRFAWLTACYAWPVVLATGLVAATSRRERAAAAGVYAVVLAAVAAVALARSPALGAGQLIFFWVTTNGPPTILFLASLHRRWRAVGPMVLAFMTTCVAGGFLLVEGVRRSERLVRLVVEAGIPLGLGATGMRLALGLLGFAALAAPAWWLLVRLGRGYEAKRFGDQSLALDSLWLLFAALQSFTFAFERPAWVLAGVVAFGGYWLALRAGFALLRRGPGPQARTLLLLRVFALGPRSRRLFDVVSRRWLQVGPIALISGPDLATSSVEPHEFLAFAGRRLADLFVRDGPDLERRLSRMDAEPDPDGRHRVNELFCHADTWQAAVRRLAARSDAVLMDLRGFSKSNQGCLFELGEVLEGVDLRRVVFVVDDATDRRHLETAFQALWRETTDASPNARVEDPEVRLHHVPDASPRHVRPLLRSLLGAPAAARPAPAAPAES